MSFSCRVLFKLLNQSVVASSKAVRPPNAAMLGQSSVRGYYSARRPRLPGPGGAAPVRVVDLRSDTVTKPGRSMRQAMAEAEVGDDVMGEDPTVNELQKIAADMFGMEAALFVPSGTMSNLIAVMVHCRERSDEIIVGDLSHLHIYEQGGSAQLAGVHSTTVTTLPDGTFDLQQLESKIRHDYPDPHYPRSRLICVENTHNIQGGRVLPLNFLQEVRALADKYGLSVHMDGARVMNAAVAQGVPPSTILQHTHTVSVCLSKGLGAPVGTMLAGPQEFITRAERCRKALGGGMRQAGILAAAGKISLLDMVGRLEEDHCNAKTFAQALLECHPPLFTVDMAAVETNILRFYLREPSLSPTEFCASLSQVCEGEEAALGQGIQVLMFPHFGNSVRAVWHFGISSEDTQLAIQKIQFVASQYLKNKL
ncbi:threonine aldolase 1 [Mastacembelus armatus]|uniref:Threonine aldolase 1 n=1 Tax=Mastacembelus armatus TaxID=205130 RepID=A0A3Q3L1T9_9TELE|nr:probable low-specificity L-threonine aldolase 2 [Mastacembelus armatus]